MTRRLALVALLVMALATPAHAHVTVNPREAAKGGYTKIALRVPNERDDSGTTKLSVLFPADHPLRSVSVRPTPGWKATVERTKLATPVKNDEGEETTETVSKITWDGSVINPGEFQEFEVSVGPLPDDADELVFKTVQTYADGEVVSWIEEAGADGEEPEHPAPVLTLVAGEGDGDAHGAAAMAGDDDASSNGAATDDAAAEVEAEAASSSSPKPADLEWGMVALFVAIIALGIALLEMITRKRSPAGS